MEYSSYTAEHLYNKHRVLSNVRRMFLLYMMGTNINTNLNEAMKTSKTSSRTKVISICSLNSAHLCDINS